MHLNYIVLEVYTAPELLFNAICYEGCNNFVFKEIEEDEDSGCEGEGQILTPPSSPESGQGHSNSSHSSSGSSMLDVHNLNLHGTGGRSAIVRVTANSAQGVAR